MDVLASPRETDNWRSFFSAAWIVIDAAGAADKRLRQEAGSAFSIFDWIKRSEHGLSAIIRDLLDPNGSHGQQEIFLQLAVKQLFDLPPDMALDNLTPCTVVAEQRTYEGRRIDLLIDFGSQAGIGIENKPWADEGNKQLEAYAEYLCKRYKGKSYSLIFLHGQEAEAKSLPDEIKKKLEPERRFQMIPYSSPSGRSLHSWLVRCAEVCQADKVRWFLRDFANYVATQFTHTQEGGSQVMPRNQAKQDAIVRFVCESSSNLDIAFLIYETKDRVVKSLIARLATRIVEGLKSEQGWKITEKSLVTDPMGEYSSLTWAPVDWHGSPWGVRLQSQKTGAKEFKIGFCAPSDKVKTGDRDGYKAIEDDDRKILGDALEQALSGINEPVTRDNPWWPACVDLPKGIQHWQTYSALKKIQFALEPASGCTPRDDDLIDGKMIDCFLTDAFRSVKAVADQVIKTRAIQPMPEA